MTGTDTSRSDELAAGLMSVRRQIDRLCADVGREPNEVTLIVVTKTWPTSDVLVLAELGVTDFGENKAQELRDKRIECNSLQGTWHFIGQLQTNKAALVAHNADVVHSVDRARVVEALSRHVGDRNSERPLDCLIQVSLDPEFRAGRGGVEPAEVSALAAQIDDSAGLRLAGVMGVAPVGADARQAFSSLREVSLRLRQDHPSATWISAGMSGDLAEAIDEGATHLRVGSAILGSRAPLR